MPASISLGSCAFDAAQGVLISDGNPIYLRPKATQILHLLASQLGRVVSKQEMLDVVWPGVFVTEDSLIQAIREIRKAIGDEAQTVLRNVSKRGYILVADQPVDRKQWAQPMVAVLRFLNQTGDGELTPIIDGFVEDIINGLSRFGTVLVTARQTSFMFESADRTSWQSARDSIGVQYLVEGVARPSNKGFRITVNLIDAENMSNMWGGSYDTQSYDLFEAQNEIAETIISSLAFRLEDAGIRRTYRRPVQDLEAYELLLRGLAVSRNNNVASYGEAEKLLLAAAEKDPASGLVLAQLAFVQVMRAGFGRAKKADLDKILVVATKAANLAPDQPVAHRVLSFIQMYRKEHAAAEFHLRRSLDLNPYDAESLEQMGYLVTLRGKPAEALQWMDRAVRLSPIHPEWYEHDRSFALYLLGEYRKAAQMIELTPIISPWMLTWLAACYAQMGDIETARHHMARIAEVDPNFSAFDFAHYNGAAFEHVSDSNHFAEGVFLALGVLSS